MRRKSFEPHVVSCDYFTVDKIVLDGEGEVSSHEEHVPVKKGDSIFITANTGEYELEGSFEALLTTV